MNLLNKIATSNSQTTQTSALYLFKIDGGDEGWRINGSCGLACRWYSLLPTYRSSNTYLCSIFRDHVRYILASWHERVEGIPRCKTIRVSSCSMRRRCEMLQTLVTVEGTQFQVLLAALMSVCRSYYPPEISNTRQHITHRIYCQNS